jgi:DNA replicative helicase MCM subunit Mcm2 (Cdc46/Mcm family)
MEEGKVTESTSAATVHPTETALLIDQNPYDEIDPAGNYNSYSRINIPIHMLSRFDYILEIKRDVERSEKIATEMTRSLDMGDKSADWKDKLKYLIAFMKDQYKIQPFSDDVRQYIDQNINQALDQLPKTKENTNLIEDMRLRMVRSVFKITKAVATANATSIATRAHGDYAMTFLRDKLAYIGTIKPADIEPELPDIDDIDKRRELLVKHFSHRKFKISEAVDFIKKNMEGDFDIKLIQRDLREIGAKSQKKPKGSWSLK